MAARKTTAKKTAAKAKAPAKKAAASAQAKSSGPSRRSAMTISGLRGFRGRKEKPTKPKPAAKSASAAGGKKKAPPAPNMPERIEGLQGWMAEIERKQERQTRLGGAAALLAVLAAGGAIALGVINQQNAATNDDVDELTEQVNELGASVKSQTEEGLKKLNNRIGALETEIETLKSQQATITQDITTLQNQANANANRAAKGVPALPGARP
jgi:uncharacterized protein HemX